MFQNYDELNWLLQEIKKSFSLTWKTWFREVWISWSYILFLSYLWKKWWYNCKFFDREKKQILKTFTFLSKTELLESKDFRKTLINYWYQEKIVNWFELESLDLSDSNKFIFINLSTLAKQNISLQILEKFSYWQISESELEVLHIERDDTNFQFNKITTSFSQKTKLYEKINQTKWYLYCVNSWSTLYIIEYNYNDNLSQFFKNTVSFKLFDWKISKINWIINQTSCWRYDVKNAYNFLFKKLYGQNSLNSLKIFYNLKKSELEQQELENRKWSLLNKQDEEKLELAEKFKSLREEIKKQISQEKTFLLSDFIKIKKEQDFEIITEILYYLWNKFKDSPLFFSFKKYDEILEKLYIPKYNRTYFIYTLDYFLSENNLFMTEDEKSKIREVEWNFKIKQIVSLYFSENYSKVFKILSDLIDLDTLNLQKRTLKATREVVNWNTSKLNLWVTTELTEYIIKNENIIFPTLEKNWKFKVLLNKKFRLDDFYIILWKENDTPHKEFSHTLSSIYKYLYNQVRGNSYKKQRLLYLFSKFYDLDKKKFRYSINIINIKSQEIELYKL